MIPGELRDARDKRFSARRKDGVSQRGGGLERSSATGPPHNCSADLRSISAFHLCVLRSHWKGANSGGKRHLRRFVLGASDTRRLRRRVLLLSRLFLLAFTLFFAFSSRTRHLFQLQCPSSKNPLASYRNDIKLLKIPLNIYVAHAAVKAFISPRPEKKISFLCGISHLWYLTFSSTERKKRKGKLHQPCIFLTSQ